MFGYVKPFKPQMKFCEYDVYRAVYCGLCKEMGKGYGLFYRFTLSYDFAFLGLFHLSLSDKSGRIEPQRCMAHPFKKNPCLVCGSGLGYTAAVAAITVYHKLRDDFADKGLKKKIAAALLLPFLKRGYKKASEEYPALASEISENMKRQAELERAAEKSIDRAAEPTAAMTAAISANMPDVRAEREDMYRFGYLLGRYIYITDAADDIEDDRNKGNYNPFLAGRNSPEEVRTLTSDSVNFTLGELSDVYTRLNTVKFRPILDNIIYLGLKHSFNTAVKKEKKKGNPNE